MACATVGADLYGRGLCLERLGEGTSKESRPLPEVFVDEQGMPPLPDDLTRECRQWVSALASEYATRITDASLDEAKHLLEEVMRLDRQMLLTRMDDWRQNPSVLSEQAVASNEQPLGSSRPSFAAGGRSGQRKCAGREIHKEVEDSCAVQQFPAHRIRLDVGGTCFSTSRSTLTRAPGSMLEAMFSGRHQVQPEDEGAYFIDRDGRNFHHILNYLRDGDLWSPPTDAVTRQEVMREADFYGLTGLVELLTPPPAPEASLVQKSEELDLVGSKLTLNRGGHQAWSTGALFNLSMQDGQMDFAVRLQQPSATHHFMIGLLPVGTGTSISEPDLYMSQGFFLFDYSIVMLYRDGVCQMLPQLRGKLQAGETLRITCREAEDGCTAVEFTVGEDPPVLACSDLPAHPNGYAPAILMNTVGMSLELLDLKLK